VDDVTGEALVLKDDIKLVARSVPSIDMNALRTLSDKLIDSMQSGIVVLLSHFNGKVHLVVRVTKNLTGKVHAGDVIKFAAGIVDGGGGGRPDMAQAGGKDPSKIGKALADTIEYIKQKFVD